MTPRQSAVSAPADLDDEPTPSWVASTLGLSLEDAEWLLIHYRFLSPDPDQRSPYRFYCEPL